MKTNIFCITLGIIIGALIIGIFIRVSALTEQVSYISSQNEILMNHVLEIKERIDQPIPFEIIPNFPN